ncbi:MAG TPA: hypothetical protein VN371_10930 [Chlorobaculum sp.]|nr:hypothetical protein [Chlorobaculum sp.]
MEVLLKDGATYETYRTGFKIHEKNAEEKTSDTSSSGLSAPECFPEATRLIFILHQFPGIETIDQSCLALEISPADDCIWIFR